MMTTGKLVRMGYNFQGINGVCYATPGFGERHYKGCTTTYRYDSNIWKWVEIGKEPLLDASC